MTKVRVALIIVEAKCKQCVATFAAYRSEIIIYRQNDLVTVAALAIEVQVV